MITTLYSIPIIISHTNGGHEDYFFSITPNKDEIDEFLNQFTINDPGTIIDGEYMDDEFYSQTFLSPNETIEGITDPTFISNFINSNTFIYGFSSITIDSNYF